MTEKAPMMQLRTIDDLNIAHEYVFNRQVGGTIDGKTADGMNTTLKGSVYLNVKMRQEALKLYVMAQKAKVAIPPVMLPDGMRPKA